MNVRLCDIENIFVLEYILKMYQKKSIPLGPHMPVTANFLSKLTPDIRRNVFRHMLQREYKCVF